MTHQKWGIVQQICGIWKKNQTGHTFLAEVRKDGVAFLAPQSGVEYNKNILNDMKVVKYWRIDDLGISDLGISSCEKE